MKTAIMITVGVSIAMISSISASNLPEGEYPAPTCEKPQTLHMPSEPEEKTIETMESFNQQVERYNEQLASYNANMRNYFDCVENYINSANQDMDQIHHYARQLSEEATEAAQGNRQKRIEE